MSGVPKLAASFLRPGYEIRRPGESEWLPVESAERTDVGLVLVAGGREFLTSMRAPWPARVTS